mgnify:CR=1 FL=1
MAARKKIKTANIDVPAAAAGRLEAPAPTPRDMTRGPLSSPSALIDAISAYDGSVDAELITRAYGFSQRAHASQTRASGDTYFSHPLEVAGIVIQMKLDSATVVTALLHDTVEDTLATIDEIGAQFGNEIGRLVDGVTNV